MDSRGRTRDDNSISESLDLSSTCLPLPLIFLCVGLILELWSQCQRFQLMERWPSSIISSMLEGQNHFLQFRWKNSLIAVTTPAGAILQPMSLILPWKSFQLQPVTLIRDGVEISAMLLMPFMHSARTLWGQFRDATGRSGSSGTLEEANNLGVEKVLDACVWDRVGWIRKRQGWWLVRWYQPTRRQPLALISLCVGQVGQVGHPPKCDQFPQGEVFPRLERKMPAVEHFRGRKSVR